MIGMNPLGKKVLITTDEVIFHGPTDSNADPRILMQSIIVAEERFIVPMLGQDVYRALIDAKNKLVTSANKGALQTEVNAGRAGREAITLMEGHYVNSDTYLNQVQQDLWREYLHKVTAECVVFCSLPHNRSRFSTKGVIKNFPNNLSGGDSASVELYELRRLMDQSLQQRIGPLMEAMHNHMVRTGYPGYQRGRYLPKINAISLEMYDDEDEKRCSPW